MVGCGGLRFRAAHSREALKLGDVFWIGRCEGGGTLGSRRIDPPGVDLLLGLLCLGADRLQFPVPAQREDRASFSQVEAGGVCLLVISLGQESRSSAAVLLPAKAPPRACWHETTAGGMTCVNGIAKVEMLNDRRNIGSLVTALAQHAVPCTQIPREVWCAAYGRYA